MSKLTTKFLCLLTAFALAVGLLSGLATTAYADSVSYQEASYNASTGVTYTAKTANATAITSSTTSLSDGWYYVDGEVTIGSSIPVTGEVHLILKDGAKLTASGGIEVASGNTLNIYAQSGGTGELSAAGGMTAAGIGGGYKGAGGTVTIHGGTVTATGGTNAAGIGGGREGAGGTVTINGGTVTASGGSSSAQGIGYGEEASSSGELVVAAISGYLATPVQIRQLRLPVPMTLVRNTCWYALS